MVALKKCCSDISLPKQVDATRFKNPDFWNRDMPDRVSLVHLEIVHAYFRKKMAGDTPGAQLWCVVLVLLVLF